MFKFAAKLIKNSSQVISSNNMDNTNIIIDEMVDKIYNERYNNEGYIYCIYNEIYQYCGENVYKFGMSKDVKQRLCGYTTPYIHDC